MLLLRISAEDERLIGRAKTEQELAGVVQLVRDRLAQSKLLKEMGRTPTARQFKYGWRDALEAARAVLGDQVTVPPFPDDHWYRRITTHVRSYGIDNEKVAAICEYVRANMRLPIKFEFMICQHERILAGEFDQANPNKPGGRPKAADKSTFGPELPSE